MEKIIVIGGVAGGATAAGRIRRLNPEAEIIMLERGKEISFTNCGLPYYVGGIVENKEDLIATTPEKFGSYYNIDVRVQNEALSIDTEKQTLTIRDIKENKEYTESYDKLLLSMGAEPTPISFPGDDLEGIFRLRSYADTVEIKEYMETTKAKRAVVVGAGFIGLEMAENFTHAGLTVDLLHRSKNIFKPLDADMVGPVEAALREKVNLHLETQVKEIVKQGDHLLVVTDTGQEIPTDMILLSLGVRPESKIAVQAGIQTGYAGGIVTNNRMETNAPNVYAIGDAVQVVHTVTGQPTHIPLAGPAQQQARVAAANICGQTARYKGSQGSSILKLFHVNAATTGINSNQAKEAGFEFDSAIVSSISHAGYYPNPEEFTMKVIYEEYTGRILGAQVVGGEGVDKRCDVLATAIYAGLTAWDLEDLQLCYAPPFAIPREAVNIIGGMIVSAIEKKVENAECVLLQNMPTDGSVIVIDVREEEEYEQGHVANSRLIPLGDLKSKLLLLDKTKTYYLFCDTGHRSNIATRIMTQAGFNAYNVCGGWQVYQHMQD